MTFCESFMIEVQNVSKRYQLDSNNHVWGLRDVSCHIAEGSWTSVVGPSGSGKSTLLALMAALDRPSSGQILVEGKDICTASDVRQAIYRKNRIGIVFQEYQLWDSISAWENVSLPLVVTSMNLKQRKQKAMSLLEKVGLTERANHLPRQLSGGERQRVSLARALVHDPEILFADEPTSNIDKEAADKVTGLFVEMNKRGNTIVVISHDPELSSFADQILTLDKGQLVR